MPLREAVESLKTRIWGAPKEEKEIEASNAIIRTPIEQSYGSRLSISLKNQVFYYLRNPVIRESIAQTASQVVAGGGFFTEQNPNYSFKVTETAKEYIDSWNVANETEQKLITISTEILAFGLSVWLIDENYGLTRVPPEAIEKAVPINEKSIRNEYNLKLTASYGDKILKWKEFIMFNYNPIGVDPLSSGIMYGLLSSPDGGTTPGVLERRIDKIRSMHIASMKFGFPSVFYSPPEERKMDSGSMAKFATQIKNMSPYGNKIASPFPVTVVRDNADKVEGFEDWHKTEDKEFYLSVVFGLSPDTQFTTKASAEALQKMHEERTSALQRVIKRNMERIWGQVLKKAGFIDADSTTVKMHFGVKSESVYTIPDVVSLKNAGIITAKEARLIMRDINGLKIITDEIPPQEQTPEETTAVESYLEKIKEEKEGQKTLEEATIKLKTSKMKLIEKMINPEGGEE